MRERDVSRIAYFRFIALFRETRIEVGLASLGVLNEGLGSYAFMELLDGLVSPCWASSFWQSPQKEPKSLAPTYGPALRSGFVRAIVAPGAGLQGAIGVAC